MSERPPTPTWLVQPEAGLCPCRRIGTRRRGNYVGKTLAGGVGLVQRAVFADEVASQPGLLQRLDARVKIVGLFVMLLVGSLVHELPVLIGLYALALALASASRIAVGFFIGRVWLFIPIFTGIVVLPATLNLITPGEIVVPLGTWFGNPVGLTEQGLHGAALLVMRVAVSISFVVLVTLTTRWTRLLAGLRSLLVPQMFVVVLAMAYRYLFHLLGNVTDMYLARRARTVRPERHADGRRFVAASAGALFGKSHHLAEEVHQAMIARGYTGNVRTLDPPALAGADVAAIASLASFVLLTFVASHALAT